jgi:RHS repeat-associated protein
MKVTYSYDARGRMTEIHNGNARPLAFYEYDAHGRRSALTRDNGVVTKYAYDNASQVLAIDHLDQSNIPLAFGHYKYDKMGRRTSMTRENSQIDRYHYDATSQLTEASYGTDRTETFSYDSLGNRIKHTDATTGQPLLIEHYTTNNLNQYTVIGSELSIPRILPRAANVAAITFDDSLPNGLSQNNYGDRYVQTTIDAPASSESSLTYDSNGNLLSAGDQKYYYNARNNLIHVESDKVKIDFIYDANNRCIARYSYSRSNMGEWLLDNNSSMVVIYDLDWNALLDSTLDGKQVSFYIQDTANHEIIMSKYYDEYIYPLMDAIGSTIALCDRRMKISTTISYDIYGLPSQSSAGYRYLFTGCEWFQQLGLSGHRNRYYHPELGRWISIDPILLNGGFNLYSYTFNNPANLIDIYGNRCSLRDMLDKLNIDLDNLKNQFNELSFQMTMAGLLNDINISNPFLDSNTIAGNLQNEIGNSLGLSDFANINLHNGEFSINNSFSPYDFTLTYNFDLSVFGTLSGSAIGRYETGGCSIDFGVNLNYNPIGNDTSIILGVGINW